jgi:MprA protease rhombosortase-interaction domain-containing protein
VDALGRPGVVASLGVALAGVIHPSLRAPEWLPAAPVVVAALALLLALGLVVRARRDAGARLLGLGACLLLASVGYDGVLGRRGSLTLVVGQAKNGFEEEGPGARSLGLRPLGFPIGLERADARVAVLSLASPQGEGTVELTRERSVGRGGFRFGDPRVVPTGEVARLRVAVQGGPETREVDVTPERPGLVEGLQIGLERYFPDFALDGKQQPFSRSPESRNPAALFVIRALPGVHRIEPLDRSFSLTSVEPEVAVRMRVTREPAAPLAGAGVLLMVGGLAFGLRRS